MLDSALRYASLAYKVFPCIPQSKKPLTEHGFKDATTGPDQIRTWWEQTPNANVAIATEGLLVVDVDGTENPWLRDQPDKLAELLKAPTATTPRGGKHFLFKQPVGARVGCSSGGIAEKVDIRADGGYLVVWPSIFQKRMYQWESGELPLRADELPMAPDWLVTLAKEKMHGKLTKVLKGMLRSQPTIPEGERNATLASLAGRLRWHGFGESDIASALVRINCERCSPPLDETEVLSIAASMSRYAAGPGGSEEGPGRGDCDSAPLKRVRVDTDEHRVINEIEEAIQDEVDLYSRGQRLVRLVRQRAGLARGHPIIVDVAPPTLREIITKHVVLERLTDEGLKLVHPPAWSVLGLHSRASWKGVRELTGLSDAPFLRHDGTVCQAKGYDHSTGVLFEPHMEFPLVPEAPTKADANAAATEILDLVSDFPFGSEAGKSAFLAALLTVMARYGFEGPAPLFLFDANVRGAGKTLLCSVIGSISTGQPVPVTSYTKNQEELRKAITSTVMAAHRLVLLDNLEGTLGCATLDRALTSTRWRDRILGGNQMADLPMLTTFLASGNNTVLKADAPRRVVVIRLESSEERPETRSEFKRKNLLAYVRENRGRLVTAGLTVLRAYWHAGRPDQGLVNFGGFEGWSQTVRAAVVYAGLPDPLDTRAELHDSVDQTVESLRAVINAWSIMDPTNRGMVVADLIPELYPSGGGEPSVESRRLRSALEELTGASPARPMSSREIGNTLRLYRRRVVDNRYFDSPAKRAGGALWKVRSKSDRTPHQGPGAGTIESDTSPGESDSELTRESASHSSHGTSDSADSDDSASGGSKFHPNEHDRRHWHLPVADTLPPSEVRYADRSPFPEMNDEP
ncbi:MAG: bifunctional DNA primase/polymerase [Phycisphaerales bacterium]|nr:bifunctional DNA primase/polymerase [Phycisphaerales bacterium]